MICETTVGTRHRIIQKWVCSCAPLSHSTILLRIGCKPFPTFSFQDSGANMSAIWIPRVLRLSRVLATLFLTNRSEFPGHSCDVSYVKTILDRIYRINGMFSPRLARQGVEKNVFILSIL